MNFCQSRTALLLALPPLAVAAFCIGHPVSAWTRSIWPSADAVQIATLISTLVSIGLCSAIWRPFLRRDRRRLGATLALAILVIGQVLVWRPMWHSSGCAQDDILRCAQSLTDLGLWGLGFAMTWWGGRRWRELKRQSISLVSMNTKGRQDMSPGTVRLAVGFALMPLLPGVFFIVGAGLHQFFSLRDDLTYVWAYAVCAIIATTVWWLVWRRAVCWTPQRKLRTALLAACMVAASFIPLVPRIGSEWVNTLVMTTPMLVLAAWFAGTAYVWRLKPNEYPADQAEIRGADPVRSQIPTSVPCGNCDYDLRGLREARCPECGWTTTLDALIQRSLAASLAGGD